VAKAKILSELKGATGMITTHLRSAWAGTGHTEPSNATLKINSIVSYPAPAPTRAGDPSLL
jgi:hypothetical protein